MTCRMLTSLKNLFKNRDSLNPRILNFGISKFPRYWYCVKVPPGARQIPTSRMIDRRVR